MTYFHEFWIYEFVKNALFSFKGAAKCLFFVKINFFSNIFYLNGKILPRFKRKQEKFGEKRSWIRKFGIRENMSWTFYKAENILYGGFHRLAWSIAVAWVIFTCCRGYGGKVQTFSELYMKFIFFIYIRRYFLGLESEIVHSSKVSISNINWYVRIKFEKCKRDN